MNTTGGTDTAPSRSRSRRSSKTTTTSTNSNNYNNNNNNNNNRLNGHKMAEQPVLGSKAISKNIHNPCNPLSYLQARQIDDRLNYCHKLVDARLSNAQNLFRKDLYSHYGCVNAIEFFKEGDLLVSGGDDKRVLLWNVEKAIQEQAKPTVMKAQHMSNIFCLGYNNSKTKIFSAGNDDQVIVHDLHTTEVLNFFRHEKPVYGLSVHPYNDNVFSSACDDGRVLIYDIRGSASSPESFFCVAQHKNPFHSVMFNPVNPVMLATANTKEGVSMWDVRKPLKPVLRYGAEGAAQSCMNVRFNQAGTTLLALRRRLPPVLYDVNSSTHICQFDQTGYYNSCTMKSCCFAGTDDKYILSGSDDFNLYMWEIPTDDSIKVVTSAHMILRGHRSIVNQVRYNEASCVLASSGVEKIIKLWSPFPLSRNCSGGLKMEDDKEEKQRRVYSHDEYIGLVLRSGQFMTHDYSHQSTDEDQRMMAFFDSLVQREVGSWSSEDVPTPQSPSEPENNNVSDHDSSDSEDSTDSDRHLVRCYLRSTLNSPSSSNVPERPLESPNRITRLIANRREKLMRLAALETTSQSQNSTPSSRKATATTQSISPPMNHSAESASASELENNNTVPESTIPNKITLRSKGIKRKHSCRRTTRTSRIRRKQSNPKEDSDTDLEESTTQSQSNRNNYHSGDGAQPSTSSGVIASHRSRYATTSLTSKTRHQQLRSTSSSSNEDNMNSVSGNNDKRQFAKSDSDSSTTKEAVPQKRKSTHIKCKTISSVPAELNQARCTKNKRQNNDTDGNNHNNKSNAALTQRNEAHKESIVTPSRSTRNILTSDSGINSGISTNEKMNNATSSEKSNSTRGRGGSSDRERIIKNFEWFQKKVDQARRGYRKRSMLPHPSSSDSSDE